MGVREPSLEEGAWELGFSSTNKSSLGGRVLDELQPKQKISGPFHRWEN